MSSAEDLDCKAQSILRAAINVNIGNIKVIAILDDNCPFNAVHKMVFKRICEEENEDYNLMYENLTIELDISIDNRSVTAVFRVLSDLWADMVLGEEFFASVKAHIHLELRLFKWSCEDELAITDMVENYDNFRALSGGSSAFNGTKSSEKEEIEITASSPEEPSACSKQTKNRHKTRAKKSKKNKTSSNSSDGINLQLQRLILDASDSTKNNSKEFVKIFIAQRTLRDMLSGEILAYIGIYSFEVNTSLLKTEALDTEEKNSSGYNMEALHAVFGEGRKHGVGHPHILSEDEDTIKLMIARQKKYEEDGICGLYRANDFINYFTICYDIPGFELLKFEHTFLWLI